MKTVKGNTRMRDVHQMSKATNPDQNSVTRKTDMLKSFVSKMPTVTVPFFFLTEGPGAPASLYLYFTNLDHVLPNEAPASPPFKHRNSPDRGWTRTAQRRSYPLSSTLGGHGAMGDEKQIEGPTPSPTIIVTRQLISGPHDSALTEGSRAFGSLDSRRASSTGFPASSSCKAFGKLKPDSD